MRKLSPAHVATAVVLVLATGAAAAATDSITTTTKNTFVPHAGTGVNAMAAPGDNTANTTANTTTTAPQGNSAGTQVTTTVSPTTNDTSGTPSQATFGRDTSFGNDSGNAALGTSPGQTSSGTFAGNSAIGIPASGDTLTPDNGTLGTNGTNNGIATGTIGGVGLVGTTGAVVLPSGVPGSSVAVNVNPQTPTVANRTPTPVFDDAARRGMSQVQRQARSGRVISQAPRTDNDRTDQMPDDPIIRY